jgi:hypothetical protein
MKKLLTPLIIFLAVSQGLIAQNIKTEDFAVIENQLKNLGSLILNASFESEKVKANEEFIVLLENVLANENSFNYPFDSLVTLARLSPEDKSFRIFNWHLPKEDGGYDYFCYIQPNPALKNKNQKKTTPFYKLTDTKDIKSVENKTLGINDWRGAHYYHLIQVKNKKEKQYVLLGWDGNNHYSTKKLIDILYFTGTGEPKFGAPVFKMENKTQKRVFFEYGKDVSMSLRYNEPTNQIIFDHLVPPNSNLKGQYQFYGPDFSYDALTLKKGLWLYEPDIDARNGKSINDKKWNNPKK